MGREENREVSKAVGVVARIQKNLTPMLTLMARLVHIYVHVVTDEYSMIPYRLSLLTFFEGPSYLQTLRANRRQNTTRQAKHLEEGCPEYENSAAA